MLFDKINNEQCEVPEASAVFAWLIMFDVIKITARKLQPSMLDCDIPATHKYIALMLSVACVAYFAGALVICTPLKILLK